MDGVMWVPSRTQAVQLTVTNVGEVLSWLRGYLPYEKARESWTTNSIRVGKHGHYVTTGDWVVLDLLTNKVYAVNSGTDRAVALGLEEEA